MWRNDVHAAAEWYEGSTPCPTCDDFRYVAGILGLFGRVGDKLVFRVGKPVDVEADPQILTAPVGTEWWRLRAPIAGRTHVNVLGRDRTMFACHCERVFAPVLRFEIAPHQVTLAAIHLLDIDEPNVTELDLICLWGHGGGLGHQSYAYRLDYLTRFLGSTHLRPTPLPRGKTAFIGPTRCEACGATRERVMPAHLTNLSTPTRELRSLFPSFTGAQLYIGDRVHVGHAWQPVTSSHMALRAVVGDTLTLLSEPMDFGCACGTVRPAGVHRFVRRGDELELVELALRTIRTEADLADIDLIEGNHVFGIPGILKAYE
jgi:hypothetical protein